MIKSERGEGLFFNESESSKPRPFRVYTRGVIFFLGGNSEIWKQ